MRFADLPNDRQTKSTPRPGRAGDANEAQSFYAKLAEICGPGGDRPELAETKSVLARESN